ncbi:Acetyl-coenzyme A carboxylase carboxyl transferase subunit beta, chloroplastic [Mycolicibacterium aubagnense]
MTEVTEQRSPATTAEKLAELRQKLELAADPGDEKAKARRDKKGIPSARARIHALVDPGSFFEIGALAKTPGDPNALYGDGVVTGHATIDGRPVAVFSHDQTVFQGSVGEMFGRKVAKLMEWVAMVGCPIIGINDSAGARIQDAVTSLAWYAELGRRHEMLRGTVPEDLDHPRQVCWWCGVLADPDRPAGGGARPGLHVHHRPGCHQGRHR